MNRIERKFIQLKKQNKKALVAFITAGYPDLATTEKLVYELEKSGVDIIELGVPFSDPLADGPVIQEASKVALEQGINLSKILGLVKDLRRKTELPICLMTYYNPVFCFGEERLAKQAAASGVDGVIIPDLPYEEAVSFTRLAKGYDVINICFIAPTSSPSRIKAISRVARGFIYYVALAGVTGSRKSLSPDLKTRLSAIKKIARIPVCAGFGISCARQVALVNKIADGSIVGSAIVAKIKENLKSPGLVSRVGSFVGNLNVQKRKIK
jgi:tryptophan synthase alpha chain